MKDEAELEHLDPKSEVSFEDLKSRISEELAARIAVGDDPMTSEGQQVLSELIADAILDGFTIRKRTSPRYCWRDTQ